MVGCGRHCGRIGLSVFGLMGCDAIKAASEHLVNTVNLLVSTRLN